MLQTKAVEPGTFSLLKELMGMEELQDFSLVGGTALALKFGNELSIQLNKEKLGIFGFIRSIKIDLVKHPHALIGDIEIIDGIRMYSNKDIAAMKISAILGRGRKKDFWDLYELLHHYSLDQVINFYHDKFPSQILHISIPYALTYFADAEESEEPVSVKKLSWLEVKKFIQKKVSDYLK